jgi:hypothetical protein
MIVKVFQEKILDEINNSGLSIEVVYFVMKDIMREITDTYNNYIDNHREEIDIAKKEGFSGTLSFSEKPQNSTEEVKKEESVFVLIRGSTCCVPQQTATTCQPTWGT